MKKFILLIALFTTVLSINAQTESNRKKNFNVDSKGLALQGYDVISYFTNPEPKKGKQDLSYTYKGIMYLFESATTLNTFKLNPEKWEPAYGGWCAYAMGNSGEKVEVNPSTFKLIDNKLYLFYNAYFTNTLPKWNKDEKNLKVKADKNWLTLQTK